MEDIIDQFENEVQNSFIRSKNSPDDKRIDSFLNFFNTIPIVDKKNEPDIIYSTPSESGFEKLSQSDKSNENIKNRNKNKRKLKRIIAPKQIIFGHHLNFSFFEIFTREIISQIFNYKKIYYSNYEVKMEEKDTKKQIKTQIQVQNEKKDVEKSLKEDNERAPEEEDKISLKEESDWLPKEKVKYLSIKDEIENMPKNKTIEKQKMKTEEKISKIEIITKKDEFLNQKLLNKIAQENANKNNNQKSSAKENEEVKIIKGDFDFLIPDISPQELINAIKNKENGMFIFYNNINFEKVSDIIGETKESLSDEKKPIEQIKKYFKLFKEFNSSENLCHSVGLKKENQKILMYVFNSEYKDYLTEMLNYNAHQKLFKEVLDEYKEKPFYSSFQNELIKNKKDFKEDIIFLKTVNTVKDKKMPKSKATLIDELVDSKLPYIYLYLPNVLIEKYNEKNNNNEMINKMEKMDIKDKEEMAQKKEKNDKKDNDEMAQKNEKMDKKDIDEMAKRMEDLEKKICWLYLIIFLLVLYIILLNNLI